MQVWCEVRQQQVLLTVFRVKLPPPSNITAADDSQGIRREVKFIPKDHRWFSRGEKSYSTPILHYVQLYKRSNSQSLLFFKALWCNLVFNNLAVVQFHYHKPKLVFFEQYIRADTKKNKTKTDKHPHNTSLYNLYFSDLAQRKASSDPQTNRRSCSPWTTQQQLKKQVFFRTALLPFGDLCSGWTAFNLTASASKTAFEQGSRE